MISIITPSLKDFSKKNFTEILNFIQTKDLLLSTMVVWGESLEVFLNKRLKKHSILIALEALFIISFANNQNQ